MEALDAIIAPIEGRHGGGRPRPVFYQTRSGTKFHLLERCTGATRTSRSAHLAQIATKGCRSCTTPANAPTAVAATVADALVHDAASNFRRRLEMGSPLHRYDRDSVLAALRLADAYAGGSHPEAARLRTLIPGLTQPVSPTEVNLELGLVLLASRADPPSFDPSDAAVLVDSADPSASIWGTVTRCVREGAGIDLALELLLQSVSVDEPTVAMLPQRFHTAREDHEDTATWLRTEWVTAAAAARTHVTEGIRSRVEALRALDGSAPVIVVRDPTRRCPDAVSATIRSVGRVALLTPAHAAAVRDGQRSDDELEPVELSEDTLEGLGRHPEALGIAAAFLAGGMNATFDEALGAALLVMASSPG